MIHEICSLVWHLGLLVCGTKLVITIIIAGRFPKR